MISWLTFLLLVEGVYWFITLRKRKKMEKQIRKTLYKLLEKVVLDKALREGIGSEEAAQYARAGRYLYVEFPDTKPLLGIVYNLDTGVTIGRDMGNRLVLRDAAISRMHCKISLQQGILVLQDLGTANGTRIRQGWFGKAVVHSGEQILLEEGNTIYLGNYRFRIRTYGGWEAVQ